MKKTDTSSPAMMLIHAPWCHFCESLRPAWNSAANSALSSGMNVIEIEMGVMNALPSDLQSRISSANRGERVSSVPSIFYVERDGNIVPYNHTTIPEQDYASPRETDRPRSTSHMLRFARDHDLMNSRKAPPCRGRGPAGGSSGKRSGQVSRDGPVVPSRGRGRGRGSSRR